MYKWKICHFRPYHISKKSYVQLFSTSLKDISFKDFVSDYLIKNGKNSTWVQYISVFLKSYSKCFVLISYTYETVSSRTLSLDDSFLVLQDEFELLYRYFILFNDTY